jgi:hypothetical protein
MWGSRQFVERRGKRGWGWRRQARVQLVVKFGRRLRRKAGEASCIGRGREIGHAERVARARRRKNARMSRLQMG